MKKTNKKNLIVPIGIISSLTLIAIVSEAADANSIQMITKMTETLTGTIKKEVRYGLEVISALVGGWHAAKSSTIQPLIMGAGAAGLIEVIFQVITM